jgi:hypothetical protein
MAFKGGLQNASISFQEIPSAGYLSGNTYPYPPARVQANFGSGYGVDQLDGVSAQILTLAASTPQTVNLFTSLVDLLGNAISPARIKFLAFKNLSTTDGQNVLVGDAGSNEFDGFLSASSKLTIFPSSPLNDGFTVINAPNATGMPITSANANLKFDPGANAINLVLIVGTASE